jgi:hypothetical protein
MRITGALVVVVALASHDAVADIKRHASVPESLRGSWSTNSDGCGAEDKSIIVLSDKAYVSSGSKCAIPWVSETASPRGSIYSARLQCSDQQAKKAAASNLIIRPVDANQISIGPDLNHLKTYQKCVAKQ